MTKKKYRVKYISRDKKTWYLVISKDSLFPHTFVLNPNLPCVQSESLKKILYARNKRAYQANIETDNYIITIEKL